MKYMPIDLPKSGNSWDPPGNTTLEACLDRGAGRWHITVDGLRIAIFASSCIHAYTDLGNGCNPSTLSQYITSWDIYRIARRDLQWWLDGPYSHEPGSHPEMFAFKTGIEKHEDYHFSKDSAAAANAMKDAFRNIRDNDSVLPYPLLPCARMAVNTARPNTLSEITGAFNRMLNRDMVPDKAGEEKDADKAAKAEYKGIEACLIAWAETQPWNHN